jgi:ribose transport system permease protein
VTRTIVIAYVVCSLSAAIGALLVTILSNWMDLARINGDLQQIVLGLVIVTAVFLDRLRRGRT